MSELTAAERVDNIIAQCQMWCRMTRRPPLKIPRGSIDYVICLIAVHQNKKGFLDLNTRQRQLFAGMRD